MNVSPRIRAQEPAKFGQHDEPSTPRQLGLAAGVGFGDLFSMCVGDDLRAEHYVWGDALADVARLVQAPWLD